MGSDNGRQAPQLVSEDMISFIILILLVGRGRRDCSPSQANFARLTYGQAAYLQHLINKTPQRLRYLHAILQLMVVV